MKKVTVKKTTPTRKAVIAKTPKKKVVVKKTTYRGRTKMMS